MERRRIPRVALLIETTRTYTREILGGVRRYVAEHGPWSAFVELRALESGPPPWLRGWDGDGILTRTFTAEMNRAVADTGLPAVELRSTSLPHDRPFVGTDNRLIGQAVAEHFLRRGYRHFATYGLTSETFFVQRVDNFRERVRREGATCDALPLTDADQPLDWEESQAELIRVLRGLPKPVGVFAANDPLGVHLLDACLRAGLAVPEEIAVVGCENEETLCAWANPPLSSVRLDGPGVGYAAARVLDGLMRGGPVPEDPVLIPPRGIVVRESSDDAGVRDSLVARACRMFRESAASGRPVTVEEACAALRASRSTLERRMKAALGRTPKEEIRRMRLREVERLLAETDLTLEDVAERTGFPHASHLHHEFRRRHGVTPGVFRRRMRGTADG
jgi:LacI family transcriptional regulator